MTLVRDSKALVDRAHNDFDAGRYTDAARALDALIARGAHVADASLLRARLAIRCGEPMLAVRLIGDARGSLDPLQRIEAEMHLTLAHAFAGDVTTAALYAQALHDPEVDVPAPTRAEISHARASVSWAIGAVDAAAEVLDDCEQHVDARSRARHLSLASAIAGKREKFEEQANLIAEALDLVDQDPRPEIPLAANLLRSLCIVAREAGIPHTMKVATIARYRAFPWTQDLGADRFLCALQLAWVLELAGDALGALRFANEAYRNAPTDAWRVMALADRAALKRNSGETSSSLIDLEDALELADAIDWHETPDEERLALVVLAELAAAVDGPRAHALLLRSQMVKSSGSRRLAYHDDRRIRAIAQHAAGVVAHAVGDLKLAKCSLEMAYFGFNRLRLLTRAATSALRLYYVTGEKAWLGMASSEILPYPHSTIARDIRAAHFGEGDEAVAQLTARQREVFRALLDGLTAKKIAERVGARPNTVRNHIARVYAAFEVGSQVELLAEVRRRKLA